ncbi:2478_t:CDS:1 [Ambispora gerdemannii]|uniref:2478_t:CDS:1 n=1 Tax=Ambispora gerdemannii TaxID=144530 RepID=A0A9N9CJW4_9GLOM|nr:2478_t:CDS:1 [Ambispora gerdemannii]
MLSKSKSTRNSKVSKNANMPIIPIDLLPDIFQHFENDRQAIYNCVFVNRAFCRTAIRILWQDPFEVNTPRKSTWPYANYRAAENIISLYLACLSYQDRKTLSKIKNLKIPQRPTFNYPQFLKYFDEQSVYIYIRSGQFYNNKLGEVTEAYSIHSAIMNLTLRESQRLHYITFECSYIFEKAPCKLTSLRHIQFNTRSSGVDMPKRQAENVANLIRHQIHLESFTTSSLTAGLSTLFDALAIQIRTLKQLEFVLCDFSHFDWAEHEQLLESIDKLVLKRCTNVPLSMVENLSIFKEKQITWDAYTFSRKHI